MTDVSANIENSNNDGRNQYTDDSQNLNLDSVIDRPTSPDVSQSTGTEKKRPNFQKSRKRHPGTILPYINY